MDLKSLSDELRSEATKRFTEGEVINHAAQLLESITRAFANGTQPIVKSEAIVKQKRHVSAKARRRMAAAQKARWAQFREIQDGAPRGRKKKGKRILSRKARKAIANAQRERWAKFRRLGRQPLQLIRKKAA